jgi:hypothetical protein
MDGDGQDDLAVYYPQNGTWYVQLSSQSTLYQVAWGWSAVTPVQGDYDGDGETDIAVYHQAKGNWYILESATSEFVFQNWGWSATPAVAAYK